MNDIENEDVCIFGYLASDPGLMVDEIEKRMEIKSSEVIFKNISENDLKTAIEMFLYLNICPYGKSRKFFKKYLKQINL